MRKCAWESPRCASLDEILRTRLGSILHQRQPLCNPHPKISNQVIPLRLLVVILRRSDKPAGRRQGSPIEDSDSCRKESQLVRVHGQISDIYRRRTAAAKRKLLAEAEKWNRMADVIAGILNTKPEEV